MTRKKISKEVRQQVYEKYDGHCAYCGCRLDYKDMQVDHIESVYAHHGFDELSNYMPSCRMCNFYKSTFGLEQFRKNLETVADRLEKLFIYRLAKKYGLVKEDKHPICFYFEKIERK